MSTGPSSTAVERARREFGLRLRAVRAEAGLTARALAAATGQHPTRVSKIENGVQPPRPDDVRAWCAACGATDEVAELLAALRGIETAYIETRRQSRAGMRAVLGAHTQERYERTHRFRVYEHNVVPGLFQTAEYCAAMLGFWYRFLDAPHDLDEAVAVRMERQRILYRTTTRVDCILEEQALRTWFGTAATQAGQLDRLLTVMSLPTVSIGIVPLEIERSGVASAGFWIFDDDLVALETPTAAISVDRPEEIDLYGRFFEELRSAAVYGPQARALIISATADLPPGAEPET